MQIPWKRTGLKEYPENNQNCLVYFAYTGFSISKFTWEEGDEDLGKMAVFSDEGGFLGDEDVLWVSLKELKQSMPIEYLNDPKFMRWDDPRAIIKKVVLLQDHIRDEGAPYTTDFVPAGTELNITCESKNDPDIYYTATYLNENSELCQCFKILKSICKDIEEK